MNRSNFNISEWPTRGYIHGAINILERIHLTKGHVSAIPAECRPASWRLAQLIYDVLDWWSIDEDCRIAFLGFPQSPSVIILGWILHRARMGRSELTFVDWNDLAFARLTRACGYLARRRILVQSSRFPDAGTFYAQVRQLATNLRITRVLAHDSQLRNGLRLSGSVIPLGWEEFGDSVDLKVLLCGRHTLG
jgi:hypothetical protein